MASLLMLQQIKKVQKCQGMIWDVALDTSNLENLYTLHNIYENNMHRLM